MHNKNLSPDLKKKFAECPHRPWPAQNSPRPPNNGHSVKQKS